MIRRWCHEMALEFPRIESQQTGVEGCRLFMTSNHAKQVHSRMSKQTRSILAVLASALLILFGVVLRPWTPRRSDVAVRGVNAVEIGNALRHFRSDHATLMPDHLSELLPSYISYPNNACLFWPPLHDSSIVWVQAGDESARKIDVQGAFVYVGQRGFDLDLVLYDRPDLWPKNDDSTCVVTLTSNLTVRPITVAEATRRIAILSQRPMATNVR